MFPTLEKRKEHVKIDDMKNFTINDTSLAVNDIGQGFPVLFIHGFPFDHTIWNRTFDTLGHLPYRNLRMIAPDLRGFGSSPLSNETDATTMEQFADDLHALLQKAEVTKKIVLCGLSMGGYIVMQYAGKYVEQLAGIVLCNTKTTADSPTVVENRHIQAENLRTKPDFLKTVADTMIPKLFAEKTIVEKTEIVQELRAVIESNNPLGAASAALGMARRPDTTEFLRKLDIPVLVICGDEDRFSPPAEMKPLAKIAKRGRYVEIANAGHLPAMEQPKRFAEVLARFLDEIE